MRDIVDDEQRRRCAVTPCRPSGCGGVAAAAALALLNDGTASPASRRLPAPATPSQRHPPEFFSKLLER